MNISTVAQGISCGGFEAQPGGHIVPAWLWAVWLLHGGGSCCTQAWPSVWNRCAELYGLFIREVGVGLGSLIDIVRAIDSLSTVTMFSDVVRGISEQGGRKEERHRMFVPFCVVPAGLLS